MLILLPSTTVAADFEHAAWIPWWQADEGIKRATSNLSDLDVIYPFVFEVQLDGSLRDRGDLDDRSWQRLFSKAERKNVDIIPTVAWFNGSAIHAVLANSDRRENHVEEIVDMVEDGDFAGVNIDYESKLGETKDFFSIFLKELKEELDDKKLTCTVEARTPPESRWREVPEVIEYANDYKAMARYCDWVEIMTYDQQRADLKLNSERKGEPYIPVADVAWVEKVLVLALEDIPAEKIMLGVPTYGRVWELTVEPDWYKEYKSIKAINYDDAKSIYKKYDVKPGRNSAGELSFSYFSEDSVFKLLRSLPVPEGTRTGMEDAARALMFATATGMTVPVNIAWYSDATAIKDKVDLAKEYGLRGVATFKVDGDEDPKLWRLF